MGGSSKIPKVERPAPAPKVEDKAVQEAAAEALRRKQRQRGFRSTVIRNEMMPPEVAKKLETMGS